jgi:LmbE family N-acetylglucosaminyl deacetylase
MNILAVGAHPDDVEISCAGTLAKYAKRGDRVFVITATSGNIGSSKYPPDVIGEIRKKEASNSASIIGAEYICLDYDDEMLFEDRQVRLKFIDAFRHCRPDVVFAHYPDDYNPDHILSGKIANDILVMLPIANIKTENPPVEKIPVLFYMETALGIGFMPQEYVDITDTIDIKKQMLLKHESQVAWMKDNYGDAIDIRDYIEIQNRYRGLQCGTRYAEGFIPARYAFRMHDRRYLP